ncbi:MAG: SdiA-regulated domain-containing protein [Aliarcobacter sp.]|nr:SdiA-regulated domain-containing protein [Aliarcobacter sp.]
MPNLRITKAIKYLLSTFFFFLLLFLLLDYGDLDDKYLFKNSSDNLKKIDSKNSLNIEFLKVITEIEDNLSGVTYSPKTDTLFAITNAPRFVYELSKKGEILRTIELLGFNDTEDITYIEDDLFAIVDEENKTFYVVRIKENQTSINIFESIKQVKLDYNYFENFGLEGITYNKSKDEFYLVNERLPKKVISVEGLMSGKTLKIKTLDNLIKNNYYLSDLSAIHFDNIKEELFLLSDESKILAMVNQEGDFISFFDIKADPYLSKMIHPEGVTTDNDGNIYIVGEPNIFLSLSK